MSGETKVATGFGGTKRRRGSYMPMPASAATSALSRRVTRLSKSLKAANPTHMLNLNPVAAITNISTTGSINDLAAAIVQGDDFDQRFGSHSVLTRMNFTALLTPGTTATGFVSVRCTLLRAQSGLAFASNMAGSYNPVADNTIIQVLKDEFYRVAPNSTTQYFFPTKINWSIKLNHRQKFSGTGASTTTGDCLYLILQSGATAGTTAPTIGAGKWEVFFKP